MTEPVERLDDIDRTILRILIQNPRIPYSDISDQLKEEGHKMSSEGIRYRVSKLFETTSILLLSAPEEHGWEVVRLVITVANAPDAKEKAFEALSEIDFWMICKTMGTFDIYTVATVKSNRDADDLISQVRSIEHVTHVEHSLETDRKTNIDNYLSL